MYRQTPRPPHNNNISMGDKYRINLQRTGAKVGVIERRSSTGDAPPLNEESLTLSAKIQNERLYSSDANLLDYLNQTSRGGKQSYPNGSSSAQSFRKVYDNGVWRGDASSLSAPYKKSRSFHIESLPMPVATKTAASSPRTQQFRRLSGYNLPDNIDNISGKDLVYNLVSNDEKRLDHFLLKIAKKEPIDDVSVRESSLLGSSHNFQENKNTRISSSLASTNNKPTTPPPPANKVDDLANRLLHFTKKAQQQQNSCASCSSGGTTTSRVTTKAIPRPSPPKQNLERNSFSMNSHVITTRDNSRTTVHAPPQSIHGINNKGLNNRKELHITGKVTTSTMASTMVAPPPDRVIPPPPPRPSNTTGNNSSSSNSNRPSSNNKPSSSHGSSSLPSAVAMPTAPNSSNNSKPPEMMTTTTTSTSSSSSRNTITTSVPPPSLIRASFNSEASGSGDTTTSNTNTTNSQATNQRLAHAVQVHHQRNCDHVLSSDINTNLPPTATTSNNDSSSSPPPSSGSGSGSGNNINKNKVSFHKNTAKGYNVGNNNNVKSLVADVLSKSLLSASSPNNITANEALEFKRFCSLSLTELESSSNCPNTDIINNGKNSGGIIMGNNHEFNNKNSISNSSNNNKKKKSKNVNRSNSTGSHESHNSSAMSNMASLNFSPRPVRVTQLEDNDDEYDVPHTPRGTRSKVISTTSTTLEFMSSIQKVLPDIGIGPPMGENHHITLGEGGGSTTTPVVETPPLSSSSLFVGGGQHNYKTTPNSFPNNHQVIKTPLSAKGGGTITFDALPSSWHIDKKGRCLRHPNIKMFKKKLLGGYELMRDHCPNCMEEAPYEDLWRGRARNVVHVGKNKGSSSQQQQQGGGGGSQDEQQRSQERQSFSGSNHSLDSTKEHASSIRSKSKERRRSKSREKKSQAQLPYVPSLQGEQIGTKSPRKISPPDIAGHQFPPPPPQQQMQGNNVLHHLPPPPLHRAGDAHGGQQGNNNSNSNNSTNNRQQQHPSPPPRRHQHQLPSPPPRRRRKSLTDRTKAQAPPATAERGRTGRSSLATTGIAERVRSLSAGRRTRNHRAPSSVVSDDSPSCEKQHLQMSDSKTLFDKGIDKLSSSFSRPSSRKRNQGQPSAGASSTGDPSSFSAQESMASSHQSFGRSGTDRIEGGTISISDHGRICSSPAVTRKIVLNTTSVSNVSAPKPNNSSCRNSKFDQKTGRCKKHPSIILAKKSKFAKGWDMVRDGCPLCHQSTKDKGSGGTSSSNAGGGTTGEDEFSEISKKKMSALLRGSNGSDGRGTGEHFNDMMHNMPSLMMEDNTPMDTRDAMRKMDSMRVLPDNDNKSRQTRGSNSHMSQQEMSTADHSGKSESTTAPARVSRMPYTTPWGESGWYTGTVNSNGKPHGQGRMRYKTGNQYQGEWTNGYSVEFLERKGKMKSGFGTNVAPWKEDPRLNGRSSSGERGNSGTSRRERSPSQPRRERSLSQPKTQAQSQGQQYPQSPGGYHTSQHSRYGMIPSYSPVPHQQQPHVLPPAAVMWNQSSAAAGGYHSYPTTQSPGQHNNRGHHPSAHHQHHSGYHQTFKEFEFL